jgi:uncharacterized protein (TIGR00255 family)
MTGYGAASRTAEDGTVTVESRSVNSRHLRFVLKGPPGIEALEPSLRSLVGERVKRGNIELSFSIGERSVGRPRRVLDEDRVRELLEGLEELQARFDVEGKPDLRTLVELGGLFRDATEEQAGLSFEDIRDVTATALDALVQMRENEGERLAEDLSGRIGALRAGASTIEDLAPQRLIRERDRLRASIANLAEGRELEEDRLAREIAVIADRWEISEELVRTRAHLDAFDEYLSAPSEEPVGKRLAFLVQELQREVNTLGAKANDVEISRHTVEMKNEIEKLREQVENVE